MRPEEIGQLCTRRKGNEGLCAAEQETRILGVRWHTGYQQESRESDPRRSDGQDAAARGLTHSCAMPAWRTADEMALIAVQSEFSSWVNSPVPRAFLPSSMTKRVRVLISVSKGAWSAIAGVWRRF